MYFFVDIKPLVVVEQKKSENFNIKVFITVHKGHLSKPDHIRPGDNHDITHNDTRVISPQSIKCVLLHSLRVACVI